MFTSMLYFLPCLVTMVWFCTYFFKVRNQRQNTAIWMLGLGTYYFASYAMYIHPEKDYLTMVMMDTVNIPLIPCLLTLFLTYLYQHKHDRMPNQIQMVIAFMPAICIGAIVGVLYYLLGLDNAALLMECLDKKQPVPAFLDNQLTRTFILFDVTVIGYIVKIMVLITFYMIISILRKEGYKLGFVWKFFFMGNPSTPTRVIMILLLSMFFLLTPLAFIGRSYVTQHSIIGATTTVLISIIIYCMAFVEYVSDTNKTVTLYDLSHITPYSHYKEETMEDEEDTTQKEEGSENEKQPARNNHKTDILIEKIVNMFEREEVFRQNDLTLETMSSMIGMGRTSLSQLINHHYGMSFRDVVNYYRVEAVKKYLLANPSTTQEAAAYHCGFKDASQLNRKFRELENDTPLMWLTHQKR